MTPEERKEQLIKSVYGNIWMEHPDITLDFVRQQLEERLVHDVKLGRYLRDGPCMTPFGGHTCTSQESGCRNVVCEGLGKSQQ